VKRSRHRSSQLPLGLALPRTWGGRRPGAGRKRAEGRAQTPHRARPRHSATHPVLVTLRACFRPLRSQHVLPTLHLAVAATNRRDPDGFRIIHLTVQYDHLHLIVEARNKASLSNGMRSVAIRIARSVNALVGRRGRFWADRWHGRTLTSPRQVRTALVYVLANFRKHSRRRLGPGIDPFSSGAWFDGWEGVPVATGSIIATGPERLESVAERAPPEREFVDDGRDAIDETAQEASRYALRGGTHQSPRGSARRTLLEAPPVTRPRTWLARVGWRRYGPLRLDEAPAAAP
jgi:REP element-mobilizing transposase RayT